MNKLTELPNIGDVLANNLNKIGVNSYQELVDKGSEKIILELKSIPDSGACINMLYAIEGAIQGIRWHGLSATRKKELREFYKSIES